MDNSLRNKIQDICAAGDLDSVCSLLPVFLGKETGLAAASFALRQIEGMAEYQSMPLQRIGFLASFTVQSLTPHLALQRLVHGRRTKIKYWPYNQWFSALSQSGDLDQFSPDAVCLLLHLEDIAPLLAHQHLAKKEQLKEEQASLMAGLDAAISEYRLRSSQPIILATFIAARRGIERHFDRMVHPSRAEIVEDFNRNLTVLAQKHANVSILDYAGIVADFGRQNWFDIVKGDLNKNVVTSRALPILARELSDHLSALENTRCKVVAVDLDNTIWSGIVGEDGTEGIAASGDYPGNAHEAFQAFLSNLRASGVLLAMVSKNNLDDAHDAFKNNPMMPLKWEDFSSHQVNWGDKATNLRAASSEINVGTDAFIFADDNPLECDLVRNYLPDTKVVELDGPPSLFSEKLLSIGMLDAVRLTTEDFDRALGYRAENDRNIFQSELVDISGYLAGLQLRLTLGLPAAANIERIVQLFAKTNQFNLTTKRYARSDVLELLADPDAEVYIAQLSDRFGDYGLIGVVVLRHNVENTEVDSFLMSCRALGRNVEESLMAFIDERARERGAEQLLGLYQPTKKNGLVADLYLRFGFTKGRTEMEFVRDLRSQAAIAYPEAVTIEKIK